MNTNKSISYLLCNKGITVNLYKLHFLSSHFSFQPSKRLFNQAKIVFHPPSFPSLQPNTHKEKLNIFYPPTFSSSQFSTPPSKQTLNNIGTVRMCLYKTILKNCSQLTRKKKVTNMKVLLRFLFYPICIFI